MQKAKEPPPRMKKLMKLATSDKLQVCCMGPFTDTDIKNRDADYYTTAYDNFRKSYRHHLFTPVTLLISGVTNELQFNKCYNPFCKWYGMMQKKYDNIKSKPSRYKIDGNEKDGIQVQRIRCNDVIDTTLNGESLSNTNEIVSNWSVGDEIKRLIKINSIEPVEKEYAFHRDGCLNSSTNPFENKELFYSRGKSSSNSQKYQCKECKKITNVLPSIRECFSYHQGRNDILVQFAKDLVSRTPVKRTCEKLEIASGTYYSKLEWLYKRCLEFLDKNEISPLKTMEFDEIWLNTDMMVYNLNNIKQKGKGSKKNLSTNEKKLQTHLLASGDIKSGYMFRSDVNYDYDITLDDVELDTHAYHCDHSFGYLRKNDRLRYSYCPQPPTAFDIQSQSEYSQELYAFNDRKNYVEGCHVKSQYTAIAHYWLIQQAIKSSKIYFVSDDDATLQSCVFRVFSDYVKSKQTHYFTCQSDKSLTLEEAGKQSFRNMIELINWGNSRGYRKMPKTELAQKKLEHDLISHEFYEYKVINGKTCRTRGANPICYPLSDKDEGNRFINCITDIEDLPIEELAELLTHVTNRTVNNFFQEIRRRVSILERPLVTARGDGKSYIYSNYNPKYAQYAVTIFRTFFNFCWATKTNGGNLTPAQRLGLTDKVFDYKDIIYFK